MKKFMSVILAMAMMCSLCMTGFAAEAGTRYETTEPVNVRIQKLPVEATYAAYPLMNMVSVKGTEGGSADAVTYTLTEIAEQDAKQYNKLLEVYTALANDTEIWHSGKWTDANGKTMDDILAMYGPNATNGVESVGSVSAAVYDMISSVWYTKEADADGDALGQRPSTSTADEEWSNTLVTKGDISIFAEKLYELLTAEPAATPVTFTVDAADPDDTTEAGKYKTFENALTQGYYLFVRMDNMSSNTDYTANSLYMLATANALVEVDGVKTLTIKPKVDVPEVDKEVRSEDSFTGEIADDAAWADTAVSGGSREVQFRLKGTLPETYAAYNTYLYVFHDTMENMNVKKDADGNIVYEVVVDIDGNWETTGDQYTVTKWFKAYEDEHNADAGCTTCNLHFGVANLKKVTAADPADGEETGTEFETPINKDSEFYVTYTAIVDGEKAIVGDPGNKNTVHLEYSSDPYFKGEGAKEPWDPGDEPTNPTPDVVVVVFTFKSIIEKVDGGNDNAPLKGAGFTMSRLIGEKSDVSDGNGGIDANRFSMSNDSENWKVVDAFNASYTSANNTWSEDVATFTYRAVTPGVYKLEETRVPVGYNQANDIYFLVEHEDVIGEATGEVTAVKTKFSTLIATIEGGNIIFTKLGEDEVGGTTGNAKFALSMEKRDDGSSSTVDAVGSTTVVNMPGRLLPITGGAGTTALHIGGAVLLVGALGAAFVLSKKKKESAE